MKLLELEPSLKENSLTFRCPMCREHMIRIPLRHGDPTNGFWGFDGRGLDAMSVRPSIRSETKPRCLWHGYITNGEIVTLSDSKLQA